MSAWKRCVFCEYLIWPWQQAGYNVRSDWAVHHFHRRCHRAAWIGIDTMTVRP